MNYGIFIFIFILLKIIKILKNNKKINSIIINIIVFFFFIPDLFKDKLLSIFYFY